MSGHAVGNDDGLEATRGVVGGAGGDEPGQHASAQVDRLVDAPEADTVFGPMVKAVSAPEDGSR